MKLFTKLALVSAVAVSSNAMAMQAMDDAALSATTGQDGINIGIGISRITIDNLYVHDKDGLAAGATIPGSTEVINGGTGQTDAGAIAIANVSITANTNSLLTSHNFADLSIDTSGGGGSPFLNVAAAVSGLNISLGEISVQKAAADANGFMVADAATKAVILDGLSLTTGKMTSNIQLGNTPQGAMITLNGTMTGGLSIKDLSIKDASAGNGGVIGIGEIKLTDTGSQDLALDAKVGVKTNGLAVTAMATASAGAGSDIYIKNIDLGTKNAAATTTHRLGDVQVSGLKVFNGAAGTTPGAVITITGH